MRFDDRLATVLSQPLGSPHDRAVRWRQLVDLVARSGPDADRVLLDQAVKLIRRDRPDIREPIRAAAARSIAGSPIPLALIAVFAADNLAVAAPLIASAALAGDALSAVRSVASPEVRRFLETLGAPVEVARVPTAPPAPPRAPEPVRETRPPVEPIARTDFVPEPQPQPQLKPITDVQPSDTAARIDRLESISAQLRPSLSAPMPRAHDDPAPRLFRWECGAGGQIEWVEGAPRGPLVGRSIASAGPRGADDRVERAFFVRAPFRDCPIELGDDGLLAGEWQISGAPAFSTGDGRFLGYRGIARRGPPEPDRAALKPSEAPPSGSDALREMIHEIKTPLNAIIGFAEMIDGQYFGPAHSRYRERAAEIVSNARSLLEAAEDLDFVARLQTAQASDSAGTDVAKFVPAFADALTVRATALGVQVAISAPDLDGIITLDPELTERLLRRFTDAILAASAAGEHLALRVRRTDQTLLVGLSRPQATLLAEKEHLLDPEFTIGGADRAVLGLGFSLRLINGLVGIAGGTMEIDEGEFVLSIPLRAE